MGEYRFNLLLQDKGKGIFIRSWELRHLSYLILDSEKAKSFIKNQIHGHLALGYSIVHALTGGTKYTSQ